MMVRDMTYAQLKEFCEVSFCECCPFSRLGECSILYLDWADRSFSTGLLETFAQMSMLRSGDIPPYERILSFDFDGYEPTEQAGTLGALKYRDLQKLCRSGSCDSCIFNQGHEDLCPLKNGTLDPGMKLDLADLEAQIRRSPARCPGD